MHDFFSERPIDPLRVLIVDDDKDTVDSLAVLVQLWGYDVQKAYDAEHALTLVRAFPPDVVFLDIGLPRIDGFHVAESLLAWNNDMRIIAISGYTELEKRVHAEVVGIHAYLLKPVDPSRLQAFLSQRSAELGRKAVRESITS